MPAYVVPRHVWRTVDDRLVLTGHPDAAFLAYPAGTELAESEARTRGILALVGDEPEPDPEPEPEPAEPEPVAEPEKVQRPRPPRR